MTLLYDIDIKLGEMNFNVGETTFNVGETEGKPTKTTAPDFSGREVLSYVEVLTMGGKHCQLPKV